MEESTVLRQIEDQSLEELGVFSPGEIEFLGGYGIVNLGSLLGATKGLTRLTVFDGFSDRESKLSKLTEKIPVELLEKYRTFESKRPMGWLGRKADDETE